MSSTEKEAPKSSPDQQEEIRKVSKDSEGIELGGEELEERVAPLKVGL